MADVEEYNAWIYKIISPYVCKRVLEVGCGIGNMTGYFLDRKFMAAINLCGELRSFRFDTVFCLNALEHIDGHAHVLGNIYHILNIY